MTVKTKIKLKIFVKWSERSVYLNVQIELLVIFVKLYTFTNGTRTAKIYFLSQK